MNERLAMFPLGSVVFPFAGVPLRIFEPRYQRLLDDTIDAGDRGAFGMTLIERGLEVGGGDERAPIGTRVRVLGVKDLEEGQRAVVVAGVERIRVVEWLPDDPHPWAIVESFPDVDQDVGDRVAGAVERLERVLALASELGADVSEIDLDLTDDPVIASYQLAALVPVTPLDSYALLAADGPRDRLDRAIEMLDDRAEMIRLQLGGG